MDSTLSKSDVSYSPVCDEKYVGVGVYPTVNLNPYPPLLLTCVNTSMTKNRVTVKIAPPDRGTNLKVR